MAHSQDKTILPETVPKEAQILDLLHEDFKSTILNMLKELKETIDEELKETRRTKYKQRENINKEKT